MQENNISMGEVMPIMRIALAGGLQGPPVFAMMDALGKNISVERLEKSIELFNTFE
jgi:glutamyl/glutaminyl-tRNA synthetase